MSDSPILPVPWCALGLWASLAVPAGGEDRPPFDLERDPVLYTVATAHSDTQWR